jgi:DNA-binding GntR family transcriptional regulator
MSAGAIQLHVSASTLADEVAEAIVDAILAERFTAGQLLTAAEIADWLGVSRTPAREAFLMLHRKRLLDKDTSRSFQVARWNKKDLLELAQVRVALETLVVELAVPKISPEDIDLLESIAMQMDSAIRREDTERLVLLDSQFHASLWQVPGNTRLLQVLEDLSAQIRYFMHITRPWDETDYATQHRDLISSLKSGDIDRAKAEIREHILSTAKLAIARLDDSQTDG